MTISFLGFIRCDGVSVSAGLACLPGQLQQTAQKKKGRQRGGISPTVHAMAGAVAADLDGGSQYPWATVAHGYHIDDNLAITARIDDSDPGGLRLWQGPGRAGPDPGPK